MSTTLQALALAAVAGVFPAANAVERVFQFTGQTTSSSFAGAQVGDIVTGTFRYDPDAPASSSVLVSPNGTVGIGLHTFNSPGSALLSAKVGSYTWGSAGLELTVHDNILGGGAGDGVTIGSAGSVTVDGQTVPGGSFGLVLRTDPGQTKVLDTAAAPTSYDMNTFNFHGDEASYGWLQAGAGAGDERLGFRVTLITPIPEPGAATMALLGMVLVGGLARRRLR